MDAIRAPATQMLRLLGVGSLLGIAVLVGSAHQPERAAHANLAAAGGRLELSNSRGGGAILTAAPLRPRDTVTGDVRVSNSGTVAGAVRLSEDTLADVPGAGGGRLSEALVLTVTEIGSGRVVYAGRFGAMGPVQLGTFAPGEGHTYAFVARLPDGGAPPTASAGDNAFKGGSASVRFVWTAQSADTAPLSLTVRVRAMRLRPRRPAVLRVLVGCTVDCRARIGGQIVTTTPRSGRIRPHTLGRVRASGMSSVSAGHATKLGLRLKPAVVGRIAAALRRRGARVYVKLTVTATSSAGNAAASRQVRLRMAR